MLGVEIYCDISQMDINKYLLTFHIAFLQKLF